MNLIVIILCVVIALALTLFPLIMSRKAENLAKKKSEWNNVFSGGKTRCAPLLEQYLVKPKGTLII